MDNKRWGKRFATIFWWCLTILPFIIALIYFIGYHLTFNSGITSAQELANYHNLNVNNGFGYSNFTYALSNVGTWVDDFSFPFLYDIFENLILTIWDDFGADVSLPATILSYMVSIQFYHLIFDFIVWLPRFFHSILEKGFDKLC